MRDRFHEECGIVGVFGHTEAANLVYLGLYALQHRGQEGSGIVASNGKAVFTHRGLGHVADIFNVDIIRRLEGSAAIGHNRYSTQGQKTTLKNIQPLVVEYQHGALAVALNGNIVNAEVLRDLLEQNGSIFQSTVDTEVIIHLIAASRESSLVGRVIEALGRLRGAYSVVLLTEDRLIVARDPYGFRPLVLGRLRDGGMVAASETCALDLLEAEYLREVDPGEIVVVNDRGVESHRPFPPVAPRRCIFEYVYFARPDSRVYGRNVYAVRKALGRELARESHVPADIVIPVPDSGVPAAIGYAEEAGLPFEMGLIRNHYVGRTFIEPQESIRYFGVKVKLNALHDVLAGQRVIVVDDSLVRGTTSRKLVEMLRGAGAREVHMRISSPPTTSPCYYGIDTPTRGELIASAHSVAEIREFLKADSLAYLSREGMYTFLGPPGEGFCDACFTGNYPVPLIDVETNPRQLHLFEARER
jgi:amidophosphoribosyltransferase